LQRRRSGLAKCELLRQRFFQSTRESFRGKTGARFVFRAHGNKHDMLERRKIAAFPKLYLLLEVTGEIVVPRELN
jgi:hypothetical protein